MYRPVGYVDRAVARNEQISPASPRADVGRPLQKCSGEPQHRGRCPHRPVGTLIERSQETNSPLPQGLGPMWASAPTNRITRLLRWEACAAPHPAGLCPATLSHGGRLWGKSPPPGVQCHGRGNILPHRPVPGVAGEEAEDGEYLQSAQQHIENQNQFAQRTEAGKVAGGSHSLQARADVVEAAQDG